MLGADSSSIERAARHAKREFSGWTLAGSHHGYVTDEADALRVIDQINASGADVLLVGMGNPIQERWLHEHRERLNVPVAMAVGGLFNYWAGDIRRAPAWLRKRGLEWLGILLQQPKKARRYLLGNPLFLMRVARDLLSRRARYGA